MIQAEDRSVLDDETRPGTSPIPTRLKNDGNEQGGKKDQSHNHSAHNIQRGSSTMEDHDDVDKQEGEKNDFDEQTDMDSQVHVVGNNESEGSTSVKEQEWIDVVGRKRKPQ